MKGFIFSQFEVWAEILLLVLIRLLFPSLLLLCVRVHLSPFFLGLNRAAFATLHRGLILNSSTTEMPLTHPCSSVPPWFLLMDSLRTENFFFFFCFPLKDSSVRKNVPVRLHFSNILCMWRATCICITSAVVIETDTKHPLNNFDSAFMSTRSYVNNCSSNYWLWFKGLLVLFGFIVWVFLKEKWDSEK